MAQTTWLMTYRETAAAHARRHVAGAVSLWGRRARTILRVQRRDFPIASRLPPRHPAVGVAWAMQHRREQRVAVWRAGYGATSKAILRGYQAPALEAAVVFIAQQPVRSRAAANANAGRRLPEGDRGGFEGVK